MILQCKLRQSLLGQIGDTFAWLLLQKHILILILRGLWSIALLKVVLRETGAYTQSIMILLHFNNKNYKMLLNKLRTKYFIDFNPSIRQNATPILVYDVQLKFQAKSIKKPIVFMTQYLNKQFQRQKFASYETSQYKKQLLQTKLLRQKEVSRNCPQELNKKDNKNKSQVKLFFHTNKKPVSQSVGVFELPEIKKENSNNSSRNQQKSRKRFRMITDPNDVTSNRTSVLKNPQKLKESQIFSYLKQSSSRTYLPTVRPLKSQTSQFCASRSYKNFGRNEYSQLLKMQQKWGVYKQKLKKRRQYKLPTSIKKYKILLQSMKQDHRMYDKIQEDLQKIAYNL